MHKQLHDINCVFEGFDGVGAIYISGITGAKNLAVLQKYNIKAVVCAARSGFLQYDKSIIQDYLYIPADDYEQFDLSQYFQKAYDFVQKNRKKTSVLVHCMAGISRSVTLVVAYLIKKYGYSMDSILSLLKRKRSIINPNEGFLKQLKSFENKREKTQEKRELKRIMNQTYRKQSYYSINKSTTTDSFQSKSIENTRRKTLSKQSKQFLLTLKKKESGGLVSPYHKRKTSVFDEMLRSSHKQNQSKISFKKPEFYSSQLTEDLNVIQVQKEVIQLEIKLQIKEQQKKLHQIDALQQKPTYEQKSTLSDQTLTQRGFQIPLAEKLQQLKTNMINEYRKNNHKNYHDFGVQNEEQKQLDLALATKILKSSKPRRYGDKRPPQLVNRFSINS